jgi:hypothetical protein
MRKKRLLIAVAFVVIVCTAIFSVVHASGDGPPYTVEQLPCGALRVHVQVDLVSRAARDRYAAQQRQEALALARSNRDEDIPVQLTFAHPLSIDELRTLAQDTDLALELILLEARDPNHEQHTVAARGAGTGLANPDSLKSGLDARNLQLVGVTAARGIVAASGTGLEKLATDERIYLPDVTPYLLATEVAAQHDVEVGQVQVSVPTPHWYISAEGANAVLP